jgi:hypothetical protein
LRQSVLFLTLADGDSQFVPARVFCCTEALLTWNQLRHFHRQPRIIAAWRHLFDPALHFLTANRRRRLLALVALFVAIEHPWTEMKRLGQLPGFTFNPTVSIVVALTLFAIFSLSYLAAKNFSKLPGWVRRHPQIWLHATFWVLLILLWTLPQASTRARTLIAGCVVTLPFLLWRLGYMMFTAQRGKMGRTTLSDHLFYCYPVWGGSDTPYGKGWDYLSANEAKDEDALAKSQLSGLKLFLLATLWAIVRDLLDGVVFGDDNLYRRTFGGLSIAIPRPSELFAQPGAHAIWLSWIALYFDLFRNVLGLAVGGHIIVGWLRFFGFNVFRNTYKPLLAESVVEFWNRYYYYFKEILVNFFFYPTFTRYFKGYPRVRIIAAVFAAAFVGNIYYHWLGLERALVRADIHEMWSALQSRLLYSFLLAAGIAISMLRQQARVKKQKITDRGIGRRIVSIFLVWTFFSIIHIWAQEDAASLAARCKFFLGLIGLRDTSW